MDNSVLEKLVLEKLDSIAEKQADMNATLAVQAQQLSEHIRRTALLEESVEIIRTEFKPVEQHVTQVRVGIKVAAAIAAAAVGAWFKHLFGG